MTCFKTVFVESVSTLLKWNHLYIEPSHDNISNRELSLSPFSQRVHLWVLTHHLLICEFTPLIPLFPQCVHHPTSLPPYRCRLRWCLWELPFYLLHLFSLLTTTESCSLTLIVAELIAFATTIVANSCNNVGSPLPLSLASPLSLPPLLIYMLQPIRWDTPPWTIPTSLLHSSRGHRHGRTPPPLSLPN